LSGRVVIVTGGANGIGWAICRRFAEAGDSVVVVDLDGEQARSRAAELGALALGHSCDVALPDAARSTVGACLARYGRLDILINNAGVIDAMGTPALTTSLNDFRRLVSVNLLAAHRMAVIAKEEMTAGAGVIINLASAGGVVATPRRTAYGSSKAGVMAMTRALALTWASDRTRVYAVAPGYVRTPMIDNLITSGKVDPQGVEGRVPLGRMGRPEEIAEVAFHLAREDMAVVSGETVVADGGFLAAGGGGGPFLCAPSGPRKTTPHSVVITGGDCALGAAIATALIAMGARVMLFGPDQTILEAIASQLGEMCRWLAGSLTDEAAVGRAAEAAAKAWDQIDALVSLPPAAPSSAFADPIATFDEGVDDAVTAAFIANKAVGAYLQRSGGGAIVNIAALGPRHTYTGEETSVGALVMMTRSLACEWAGYGIRVNAVTGAPTLSPFAQDSLPTRSNGAKGSGPDLSSVAETVRFLTSDASSYVTGAAFVVGRSPGP
jgi:NAD(P)-dependent dehydrogenase (short-subunit alcohol dehydrogenase family)